MSKDRLDAAVAGLLLLGVSVSGVLMAAGLLAGGAGGDMMILRGTLVLILTPVLRVALVAVGFALRRDWLYCVVSLGVLGLLGVAMLKT